ncbi:hypothetical protein [Flavobacterium sp. JAS]|uniref:hypothetical protein n=1 Tax=Flavobacterium sp. JAS TaxID=2897329 RepID=UPI001E615DEB|nr:hypothetical protein [Flavobacterium sp. JAS]MCD0469533.1 hypothetical protein [Flavobacterium sp. JAS]
MKKISIALILFCFFISCEKEKPNFSEGMIAVLADRGEVQDGGLVRLPPPPVTFLALFIKTDSNEILLTSSDYLLDIYKQSYSNAFQSFKSFLNAVLNDGLIIIEKKVFKHVNYPKRFKLNSKIEKEYSDLGFDKFLKKYSKETDSKKLAINRANIKDGEYLTITYILFKNRYDISSDCYLGIDYITKREDSFK